MSKLYRTFYRFKFIYWKTVYKWADWGKRCLGYIFWRITTISHFLADGSRINYTPDEYFDTVAKIPEYFKNPFDE